MNNLRTNLGRILAIGAAASFLTIATSGCFHIVGNQQYRDFRIAQSGYETVSRENDEIKEQLANKGKIFEELAKDNEAALKQLEEYQAREIPEQTKLRYQRDIISLETEVLRLQKDKTLLEKRIAEYETAKIFSPIDPNILRLKEKIASLESEVSSYKIDFENANRENNKLRKDNPEIQYLKELNNKLNIQNSQYRTLIDRYRAREE